MKKGKVTILASIIAIALVSVAIGAGTLAYFSDTALATGNTFTTGTADLAYLAGGVAYDTIDSGITKDARGGGIYPGWNYMYDEVVLTNEGTLDLAVKMTATITQDKWLTSGDWVSDLLYLEIYDWVDSNADENADPGEGTLLWTGTLADLAGATIDLGVIEDTDLSFDPGHGNPSARLIAPNPKGLYFNYELMSTGSNAIDNEFQGFVLTWDAIMTGVAEPGIQCPSW